MQITVEVLGYLVKLCPTSWKFPATLNILPESRVYDVINKLGIENSAGLVFLVNGHAVEVSAPLNNGDLLIIAYPVAGG